VYFSFVWFVYVPMCPPPALHNIDFIHLMTRYSLFVLKVSLNTNKTNKQRLRRAYVTVGRTFTDTQEQSNFGRMPFPPPPDSIEYQRELNPRFAGCKSVALTTEPRLLLTVTN